MWLSIDHERIVIQVWDADEQMPVVQQADLDAEHGRGLLLVESLSDAWGSYRPQHPNGKIVWAVLH
jgi:hypothetical protein